MKKYGLLTMVLAILLLMGCQDKAKDMKKEMESVKVQAVQETENPEKIDYVGFFSAKTITKKSFKSGGKIEGIYVSAGDFVEQDTLLASIEPKDFQLGQDASGAQYQAAKLDLEKAKTSLDYLKDQKSKIESLYQEGAVAKKDVDDIKLQVDVQEKAYRQAQKAANQAYSALAHDQNTVADTKLTAEEEGYVVSVMAEKGELIGAGYPAVILRSKEQIVKVGILAMDLRKMSVGMKAQISIEDKTYEGKIAKINAMPDGQTGTYPVEISLSSEIDNKDFYLGEVCHVAFNLGSKKGVWISLAQLLNDGSDYVYVIDGGSAKRRDVEILNLYENQVRVSGLTPGEQMVIEGADRLREGKQVSVIE